MKNRNVFLFLCGLALMLTMYNCQRVDEPLPTTPNAELLKGFTDIKMDQTDLVKPEPVVSTPSVLLPAAIKLDFRNGLLNSNSQSFAELTQATEALVRSLSASDIDKMAELNLSIVNTLMAGGELPDDLKRVVERAESSPALSVYLRKLVLPTVEEMATVPEVVLPEEAITASNARTAASSTCQAQAQAAFEAKRDELRGERNQQLANARLQNRQAIANATAAAEDCKRNASSSYDDDRAAAQQTAEDQIALILASNASNARKRQLLALVRINLVQTLNAINRQENSDRRLCDQVLRIAIVSADRALASNQRTIQANFEAAVETARAQKAVFIANCQYQQGQGN